MINIYIITNTINGKQYVGKTKHSLSHRFSQHCNNDYYNTYIHNAIKKYGKENFTIELLCVCDDSCWTDMETFYIKKCHTHYSEGGYNLTWGGEANPMDEEIIRKLHREKVSTPERRKIDTENIKKYNNSELRKLNDIKQSERQRVYM